MSSSLRFQLPLLNAAQAQKHVTLNEALVKADALASARVESLVLTTPPTGAVDGEAYVVGAGATGDWAGEDGKLALFLNGGWDFLAPWSGMTVWVEDQRATAIFVDDTWLPGRVGGAAGGAATLTRVVEIDHTLAPGVVSTTGDVIPDKAIVLGVTGRVLESVAGATSWSLGVPGSSNRYGSGYGTSLNAFAHGVTGQPQAYFGATPLEISADGGSFTDGKIRLAIHYADLRPPTAV